MRKRRQRGLALLCAAIAGAATVIVGNSEASAAELVGTAIGQATTGDSNVLAVDATADGSAVKVRSYRIGSSSAVALQRWTFELVTGSGIPAQTFRIKNVAAGKCLEKPLSEGDVDGADVVISPCASATNQYWTVPTDYPVNGYRLVSARDHRCLDLYNSADGALTTMWTCTSIYPTQLWSVRRGAITCNDRFVNGICLRPSEPIFGAFATWRQFPMDLGSPGGEYNTLYDYMGWETRSLNNGNAEYDYLEMGWQGQYDAEAGTTGYHAYWLEQGFVNDDYVYNEYSLAGRPGGTAADGGNHVYMTIGNHDTGQWDVYYDYNPVGITKVAEGDRLNYLETGLLSQYDEQTTLAAPFDNYLQMLNGNAVWRRPYLGEVAGMETNACNGPPNSLSWGIPNTPPYCYNVTIGTAASTTNGPEEFQHVAIAKPGTTTVAPAMPEVTGPARVLNGVDQRALAACLGDDPGACLRKVPGLWQCVQARKTCNATKPSNPPALVGHPLSAAQATARATHALPGHPQTKTVTVPAEQFIAASGIQVATDAQVHVVSGSATVDHFNGRALHAPARGFVLAYSAADGALLSACLGAVCRHP